MNWYGVPMREALEHVASRRRLLVRVTSEEYQVRPPGVDREASEVEWFGDGTAVAVESRADYRPRWWVYS